MEKNIKTTTKFILMMCHIVDEYETFNRNFNEFFKKNNFNEISSKLVEVSKGQKVFGARKVKKFYEENKSVIDKINKYYYISNFIYFTESQKAEVYQYLIDNRNKLDSIIKVLEKLNKLGIDNIVINDSFDFTREEYEISAGRRKYTDTDLVYVDNIEIVPSYNENVAGYRTLDSNYKIVLGGWPDKIIYVNDFAFDAERLPDTISHIDIIDSIILKKAAKKEMISAIRNSVDLSLGIEDLVSMIDNMDKIVDNLECFDDKDKLVELLFSIRNSVTKVEDISKKYDSDIIKHYNSEIITQESLAREKTFEKSRRYRASQHLD